MFCGEEAFSVKTVTLERYGALDSIIASGEDPDDREDAAGEKISLSLPFAGVAKAPTIGDTGWKEYDAALGEAIEIGLPI